MGLTAAHLAWKGIVSNPRVGFAVWIDIQSQVKRVVSAHGILLYVAWLGGTMP